ncbi:hypothetical protein GGI42DRAFT_255653 [Trichoderma sp. SZMC 28013]
MLGYLSIFSIISCILNGRGKGKSDVMSCSINLYQNKQAGDPLPNLDVPFRTLHFRLVIAVPWYCARKPG